MYEQAPTVVRFVITHEEADEAIDDCELAAAPPMQAELEEDWMVIGDE